MAEDRWQRYGVATGIVFVVLLIVGFLVVIPTPPDVDASAEEFSGYFQEEQDGIRIGLLLISIGLFFFLWFLGSLRAGLAGPDVASERLSAVAFAGGLIGVVFIVLAVTTTAAAAFRPEEAGSEVTRALNDVALVAAAPTAAGFTALFAAPAILILRTGRLPAAVGVLTALAAITQPFAFGTMFTDSGAFAADGALGLYVPVIGFVVGILALSIAMIQQDVTTRATRGATAT